MPVPETPIDLQNDIYTPTKLAEAHKDYQQARKDLTLSRLSDFDITIIRLWNVIIDGQHNLGLDDAARMDEAEFMVWVNAKRAIDGKERDAQNTVNQNVTGSVDYKGKAPTQVYMQPP